LGKALKDNFTLATDGQRVLNVDADVAYIRINPSSNLSAFKVGTSSGAGDVVPVQAVTSGGWKVFNIGIYFPAATTLYFQGITAGTDVVIIKL
jgi:hypothetical protein